MSENDFNQNESQNNGYDEQTRKVLFILCYIVGLLFFLPLIFIRDDERTLTHVNNGFNILLLAIIGNVVFWILNSILPIFGIFAWIWEVLLLVLCILGIIEVVTDKNRPLPVIGMFRFIK